MRYFDSREMDLAPAHIMASGALPPAFPAVTIDGEHYWDGGIYSNTPIEVVLDERPRRNSLIFSVNLWQPAGTRADDDPAGHGSAEGHPVASRGKSHVARQEQIHRLRHVIRELSKRLTPEERADADGGRTRLLWLRHDSCISYGCSSPRLDGEDHTKDIDFTRAGIRSRWNAGYEHAAHVLSQKPWECEVDMLQGVVIHESME